jgi:hypothetical protein
LEGGGEGEEGEEEGGEEDGGKEEGGAWWLTPRCCRCLHLSGKERRSRQVGVDAGREGGRGRAWLLLSLLGFERRGLLLRDGSAHPCVVECKVRREGESGG